VCALGVFAVPEYFSFWDRVKSFLLCLLVIWLIYAGMVSFYLVGTGLAELENARHDARTQELIR